MAAIPRPGRSARRWPWAVAAGLLLGVLVAYPLVELFRVALGEGVTAVRAAVTGPGTSSAVGNTILVGVAVTVLAVPLALAAATVTERLGGRARSWGRAAMVFPLVIPPFVSALSWDRAYGPGGLLDDAFGLTLPGLFGAGGVIVVIAVNAVPVAYLVLLAAMASRGEVDLERAARASGATWWGAFRTVTVPLLRPALLAATALVFVLAVNSFGVPAVLGLPARFVTMTTRIYQDFALSADPASFTRALVMAAGLVLIALVVVAAVDVRAGALPAERSGQPSGPQPVSAHRRRGSLVALWSYLAVAVVFPFLALVLTALTKAVGLAATPGNWTLANFQAAVEGPSRSALLNSTWLAIAAATLVLAIGGLAAAIGRSRWGRAVGTASVLTFAVPGSALAVAVFLAYGSSLRDSLVLIAVAYLAKFWALGHRPLAGSLANLGEAPRRAARVSGAGGGQALRLVVLPLLRPALAASWLVVFIFAFHELTMSSLLYGPGSETLAVVILNLRQLGDLNVTSALAVLLTAVVVVAGAILALGRRVPWPSGEGRSGG